MQTWTGYVREVYSSLDDLMGYDGLYDVARRCGFDHPEDMWEANPKIGGSADPADFGLAKE